MSFLSGLKNFATSGFTGIGSLFSATPNIVKSTAVNPAMAVAAKAAPSIAQTASNVVEKSGGLFDTIKNTATAGFTSLASTVSNVAKTTPFVEDRTVKTGLLGVPASAKDKLTGFGTTLSNTVGGWLDSTIQTGLNRASESVFDALYGTTRPETNQPNLPSVTNANEPIQTTSKPSITLGGGFAGFIPTNSTPQNTQNSSVIPTGGFNPNLLTYALIGAVVFVALKKVRFSRA